MVGDEERILEMSRRVLETVLREGGSTYIEDEPFIVAGHESKRTKLVKVLIRGWVTT